MREGIGFEAFRFLRQVVDMDPNLIFAKDRQGRFVFANQSVADAYGTTISDLLGRTDADFNPSAAEVEHYRQDDLEVMDSGFDKFIPEEQVSDRFGQTRWFQTVKRAIRSPEGTVDHVLGVSVDITHRKRVENSLRRRTERLAQEQAALLELARAEHSGNQEAFAHICMIAARMLDVARVSIWRFDDQEAVRVYLHDERRPASPQSVTAEVRLLFADYPEFFTALRDERTIWTENAAADPRTASLMAGPLRSMGISSFLAVPLHLDGKLAGVMVNAHLGPPRRWTLEEQSFAASIADFVPLALEADRRRVVERQFVEAQKMEAVGLLAGGLAHDFNNLLTAILGFVSVAKRRIEPQHPVVGIIDRIEAACGRAGGMTRQLLAFSKHQSFEIESLDVNLVVSELSRLLTRVIHEDIELIVECSRQPLVVRADRTQLDQVLLNLCTNACHAMPHGGQLRVITDRVEIGEHSLGHPDALPGTYLRLSVIDTGVGIEPDVLQRIWEPFFTTKEEGTGLGLATVYAIVRRLNGYVAVESEPGRGTRFDIHLPLTAAPIQAMAPEPAELLSGRETLLFVDDEPMLRELIGEGLSLFGYRLLCAGDGSEALELFRQHGADINLAVVDMVMPELSGPALCRQLMQLKPDLPILLMSGHASDRDEDGSLPMIAKPFKVPALARRIRQLLDVARGRGTVAAR
jgi:PAS domain S-box-containing protein